MRQFIIGVCVLASAVVSPAVADSQFVRELDAYCVSSDGTREGVAASQDGATNFYVQRPTGTLQIVRSSHNRRAVSHWHARLDAAGFAAMEWRDLDAPYCAIERLQAGRLHRVQWREDGEPAALGEIFASMLGAQTNSHGAWQ